MIALDTNVWVRYVTNDDPVSAPGWISWQRRRGLPTQDGPAGIGVGLTGGLRTASPSDSQAIPDLGLPMVRTEQSEQVAQRGSSGAV
jgi:hypothetical protein